jgi:hypothetical protein
MEALRPKATGSYVCWQRGFQANNMHIFQWVTLFSGVVVENMVEKLKKTENKGADWEGVSV